MNYPDDLNPFHSSSVQNSQKSYLDDYALPDEFPFSSSTVPVKNKVVSTYPLLTDNLPDALHPPQVSSTFTNYTRGSSFLIDDLPDSLLFHQLSRHVSSSQKSACCDECELPDKLFCNTPKPEERNQASSLPMDARTDRIPTYQSSLMRTFRKDHFLYFPKYYELPQISTPAVIADDWFPITDLENDIYWGSPARLGRAVGMIGIQGATRGCTAWNMGGPYISTNAHCRTLKDSKQWDKKIVENADAFRQTYCNTPIADSTKLLYSLGLYGTSSFVPSTTYGTVNSIIPRRDRGISDAINRLVDLGFPETVAKAASVHKSNPNGYVREWPGCQLVDTFFWSSENCLDLDIYKCPPQRIHFQASDTSEIWQESVDVLPSHVFGSIQPTEPPYHLKNLTHVKYALVSANIKESINPNIVQLLLSTGRTKKILGENCFNNNPMIFEGDNTFILSGSSGSPIIDHTFSNNKAIGSLFARLGDTVYASAFPKRFVDYVDMNHPIKFNPSVQSMKIHQGHWFIIGGTGFGKEEGAKYSLNCPQNFAAAGIIASTASNGRGQTFLGNFGLVCLPFSEVYQFDKAIVVTGGSDFINQLGYKPASSRAPNYGEPFDSYFANHVSYEGNPLTIVPQRFAMCPPNFFLSEVEVLQGTNKDTGQSLIQGIYSLRCRRVLPIKGKRRVIKRELTPPIGHEKQNQTPFFAGCKLDNSYVTGMSLARTSYTHGIAFNCGQVPPNETLNIPLVPFFRLNAR